jgi:acetoin utilization deacetylase AcuC-like enzyme
MAVAIEALKRGGRIHTAHILDFDLHFGDGTENILGRKDYVTIHNPGAHDRPAYLAEVEEELRRYPADVIGVSAGFDNHRQDWGGLLTTEDYADMGRMVRDAARRNGGGCFALLEGGYNHEVLGRNALALMRGLTA